MIWPLIPFSYNTVIKNLPVPAPAPPSWRNLLGTDDQARDVLARVIYGFRISILFGFALTLVSSAVGIAAGAIQGFYGGAWTCSSSASSRSGPECRNSICLLSSPASSPPGFWVLLIFLLVFSWMSLTGVVRAEFLRGRNLDYVRAAKALGVRDGS